MASLLKIKSYLDQQINNSSVKVYLQSPSGRLNPPYVLVEVDDIDKKNANDDVFILIPIYKVTIVDNNVISQVDDIIRKLPTSTWVDGYVANELHHTIYTIY